MVYLLDGEPEKMTGHSLNRYGETRMEFRIMSLQNRHIYNNKKVSSQTRDLNGQIYDTGQGDEKSPSGRSGEIH